VLTFRFVPSGSFVVDVVIAARENAATLGEVIDALPSRRIRSVVVVDRHSRDNTAEIARDRGCVVLRQRHSGYGAACRRALAHLESLPRSPDAVVLVAADGSDAAGELASLLEPIETDNAELVIGVRPDGARPRGSRLALGLIGVIYRRRFADLSPLRAIRFPALVALAVGDLGSGWDAEMLVKAVKLGLRIVEVPVAGGLAPAAAADGLARTSRSLFRILRHATAR
jgi:glycosyltransferase involved in cell wall biosynthesis